MSCCEICTDPFNKSTLAPVICQKCPLKACRKCTRRYLLEQASDPHCMGCKHKWDRECINNALTKSFVQKQYRKHRKDVLYNIEKGKLHSTMPATERYMQACDLKTQAAQLCLIRKDLIQKLRIINQQINNVHHKKWVLQNPHKKSIQIKRDFVQPCPCEGCRGYLSTAWRCQICKMFVCPTCRSLKGAQKDIPHTCDPNKVANIEHIKKHSKPCPKCAAPIHKINGCDQMWCTQCKTAFSWRSGRIINHIIHNPHFFEWQRQQNNGVAPRVPDDGGPMQCGMLPQYYMFNNKLGDRGARSPDALIDGRVWNTRYNSVSNVFRNIRHLRGVEIRSIQEKINYNTNHETLRVRYILKEIDEEKMKTTLIKRDSQRAKLTEILHVYELINTICTEQLIWLYNNPSFDNMGSCLDKCNKIREYANQQLKKISVTYSQVVGIINARFNTIPTKFKKAQLVEQ